VFSIQLPLERRETQFLSAEKTQLTLLEKKGDNEVNRFGRKGRCLFIKAIEGACCHRRNVHEEGGKKEKNKKRRGFESVGPEKGKKTLCQRERKPFCFIMLCTVHMKEGGQHCELTNRERKAILREVV